MNVIEFGAVFKKALSLGEKYKYAILVLLIGLALVLIPTAGGGDTEEERPSTDSDASTDDLEARLESALGQIQGVGRVEVVLSLEQSGEDILARDETESESKAVTVRSSEGTETVTVRSLYPVYRGALVVCDGGNSPTVKLAIVSAVSALTGLGSDKITVVTMKST